MNYLYYCNSTYQLLNLINLHWHRKNAGFENIKDYKADLLLLNSFDDAKEIYKIICDDHIFDRVTLIEKSYNTGLFHSFVTLIDAFSPAFYMNDKYGIKKKDIANKYDVIMAPKYSMVVDQIWKMNKKAKLHLYEDGIGSYYDDIPFEPRSSIVRTVNKIRKDNSFHNYQKLYLVDKSMYSGTLPDKVVEIPIYDVAYLQHIKELFREYSFNNYGQKDIFWLSQFLNNEEYNVMVDKVLQSFLPYKERVLFCQHPRKHLDNKYDFDESDKKQIWEMKLLNMEDIENKLFVSIHSTACFSAKMLFDFEPYIILFYKLGSYEVAHISEEFEETVLRFKNSYRDPEKIMIPENMEELQKCILRYTEKVK